MEPAETVAGQRRAAECDRDPVQSNVSRQDDGRGPCAKPEPFLPRTKASKAAIESMKAISAATKVI